MITLAAGAMVTMAMRPPAYAKELQFNTQAEVRNYIVRIAAEYGVPSFRALYIAEHESQFVWRNGYFEPTLKGDDGASIGLWQIDLKYHKDITRTCAQNIECSTLWAMPHILNQPNIWSAWRHRCGTKKAWYRDCKK